jgi:rubrerythrin
MREGALVSAADDGFLAGMKADFAEFRDRGKALLDEMSQLDLYRKAQGFEKESMELYIEKAEETEDPAMRRVLVSLASQEKMHYNILDTIIILVSRPELGNWLEDAEWFHLEQY